MTIRRVVGLALAACLITGPVAGAAPGLDPAPIEPAVLESQGLTSAFVHAHPGALHSAVGAARAAGVTVAQRYEAIQVFHALGTAASFRALALSPAIEWIESNKPIHFFTDSSHAATRSDDVYRGTEAVPGLDGSGVGVAVIDTGVDGTLPALRPALDRGANFKILCPIPGAVIRLATVSMSACPTDTVTVPMEDTDTIAMGGHGTHVAGIIAGAETTVVPTDTSKPPISVRGAAPGAALYGVGAGAALSVDNAMDGLEWVLTNHDVVTPAIEIVNNSWGTGYEDYRDPDDPTQPEFFFEDGYRLHRAMWKIQDELVAEGVTLVFAAGNSGGGMGSAPTVTAECVNPTPGIVCVANYNDLGTGSRSGVIDGTSSRGHRAQVGTWPDVAAPGTGILSTCRTTLPLCDTGEHVNDEYFRLSGTSMAAPHVAGVIAQLLQADPTLAPAAIEDLLEDTAHKFAWGTPYGRYVDETNPDDESTFEKGHGLVDALAALQHAATPPVATPSPDPVLYNASGTILGQAAWGFIDETVPSNASVTRHAFEASCTRSVPEVDGYVFEIPEEFATGEMLLTASGSNLFGLWDLNLWLYSADCERMGNHLAGFFGDVSARLPEGARYAVVTNHFFALTTVGIAIQRPPLSFIPDTASSGRTGETVTFGGLVTTPDESPVAGAPLRFTLSGIESRTWEVETGGDGIGAVAATLDLPAGSYTLELAYLGTDPLLQGATLSRPFEIAP